MLSLLQLLKKKPWENLVYRLTNEIPRSIQCVFLLYTLLLPLLVILTNVVEEMNGIWVGLVMNLFAGFLFFIVPRYLRSGNNLLSLHEEHRKPLFSVLYHTVLKLGSVFGVIVFSYTVILLVMMVLEQLTGISQSQKIPDLTHMTFFDITYNALTAGLTEEVWRISAIIVTLLFFKKVTQSFWAKSSVRNISLIISFVATSFVFGWLHTFGYSDSYFSIPITVQLGLIGMVLGGISLLTRRLWLAVFFHFFFDFLSFTLNAKASHLIQSEEAYERFVQDHLLWFAAGTYFFFFLAGMFFLSIYFFRFSKGGKKVHQNIAQ